jgi:hypothetical protein
VAAAALTAPCSWAGELAGVTMSDRAMVGEQQLQLNGMGVRKKLWVKVYVAGLYLAEPARSAEAVLRSPGAKRMTMHFLTDKATKAKMDEAWLEGFRANSPEQWGALEARVERFVGFFGDMKEGDRVDLDLVPGEGTTVTLNGEVAGTVEGDDFQTALLKVWVGETPPTEDLRAGVLGG